MATHPSSGPTGTLSQTLVYIPHSHLATHPSSGPRGTLSQVVYYWIMICTVHALYTVPNYSLYHSHLATPVIWTSRHTVPIVMLFDMYRTLSQLQYSLYVPQPLGYTHTRHLVLSAHCPKIYTIGYLHALYSVHCTGGWVDFLY